VRRSLPVFDPNDGPDMWIQVQPADDTISMDKAIDAVFAEHSLEKLGGASGRGWSWYATMQKCWHLYKKRYVDGDRDKPGIPGAALEVGVLLHALLAVYYSQFITEGYPLSPRALYEGVIRLGALADRAGNAWRLMEAYEIRYEQDYFQPLAVEEWAADPVTRNSCRYDAIVEVVEPPLGMSPGVYICEHKTASRFDATVTEGWRNDGEVIGQMMLWESAGMREKYGECQGVIVNMLGKQKIPQFTRVIVPPQSWQLAAHARELKVWRAMESLNAATGSWPRSRANCVTKFGFCDYFEQCSNQPGNDDPTND
jgi:hypothetical protein